MMGCEQYPVGHDGLALTTQEVVPDYMWGHIRNERNQNWQHLQWTRKQYGKQFLYFCFRSLETRQELIPVEIHNWVHENYDPPKFPHPTTALHEIMRAAEAGEKMHVRSPEKKGGYDEKDITSEVLKRCLDNWHDLKRGQ
jgi:hypothetical protein